MKTESLIKNIIFDDLKFLELVSLTDLENIKNKNIKNTILEILIV